MYAVTSNNFIKCKQFRPRRNHYTDISDEKRAICAGDKVQHGMQSTDLDLGRESLFPAATAAAA